MILTDGRVVELENYASSQSNQFKVHRDDIRDAIAGEQDAMETTFWHSHPGGGIGPSRIDLQQKTPFRYHLVLAIVDQDIIPTWY